MDKLSNQSGLTVPNRTVPYIPPLIRFGSRSILSNASRTYPLYGTVRFILRAGYSDSVRLVYYSNRTMSSASIGTPIRFGSRSKMLGTARGCTVWGAQSVPLVLPLTIQFRFSGVFDMLGNRQDGDLVYPVNKGVQRAR